MTQIIHSLSLSSSSLILSIGHLSLSSSSPILLIRSLSLAPPPTSDLVSNLTVDLYFELASDYSSGLTIATANLSLNVAASLTKRLLTQLLVIAEPSLPKMPPIRPTSSPQDLGCGDCGVCLFVCLLFVVVVVVFIFLFFYFLILRWCWWLWVCVGGGYRCC